MLQGGIVIKSSPFSKNIYATVLDMLNIVLGLFESKPFSIIKVSYTSS